MVVIVVGGILAVVTIVGEVASPWLYTAAREGNSTKAKRWVSIGANVDHQGDQGRFALHEAAITGNVEVIQTLLRHGAEVDCRDSFGQTPLMFAAWSGDEEAVAWLIESGADVNAAGLDGMTPLYSAASAGRSEVALLLLKHGARPDVGTRKYSVTNLVVYRCDADVLKQVLAAGAEIDQRDTWGRTAIGAAIRRSSTDKLKLLLEHRQQNSRHATYDEVAEVDGEELRSYLHSATRRSDNEVVEVLLTYGADPNHADAQGKTPLHLAAATGNLSLVKLLLKFGADAGQRDHAGLTPLDAARQNNHLQVAWQMEYQPDPSND